MELLNISFAILVLKITFCVLPGAFGIFLIASSNQVKRKLRNRFCSRFFGIRDAIRSRQFARFLYLIGTLLLIFSVTAVWFLVLRAYF